MSSKNAHQFLLDIVSSNDLRSKFIHVNSPEEFLQVSKMLGYDFTTEELKAVVKDNSKNIVLRRTTGVWQWLRSIPWLPKD